MQNSDKPQPAGGIFISFEGTEGTGKTTQAQRLATTLRSAGYEVCETREPGGTVLGEELRRLVKHRYDGPPATDIAELLLMAASRAQLVQEVIKPALAENKIVICDRFADSTTVYQGYGRGIDADFIQKLHAQTVGDYWPRLTLLLDLDLDQGLSRASVRAAGTGKTDRFEEEAKSFHQKIERGFLALAAREPERLRVVSAAGTEEEVHDRVMEEVQNVLTS
ncbi:MAG: dTMP kinase [Lentisphaeria bacterium]